MSSSTSLFPDLFDLLARQPAARLGAIARAWGRDDRPTTPTQICELLTSDHERFRERLLDLDWTGNTLLVLIDMVQDFGMPITLYPDDHRAKNELARLGLIYPCPPEWGLSDARHPQWAWTMPVEIAVLCAQVVPIFRPRLPLMLATLSVDDLSEMAGHYGLAHHGRFTAMVMQLANHFVIEQPMVEMLMSPQWQDHLFTLQIVLEWHGICHRQELFSFAWGDETLRPLTARDQRSRERWVEQDLKGHGFLFDFTPPEREILASDHLRSLETGADGVELLVLPEELRPLVWLVSRQLQEHSLRELVRSFGGWSVQPHSHHECAVEPTDRLKALGCFLESQTLVVSRHRVPGVDVTPLMQLEGEAPHQRQTWEALLDVAMRSEVVVIDVAVGKRSLALAADADDVLDDGPSAFAKVVLEQWVAGMGPSQVDEAQNLAFGISEEWLDVVRPLTRGTFRRASPLDAWWLLASGGPAAEAFFADAPLGSSRQRRFRRPVPTWLGAAGLEGAPDVSCGNPRQSPDREALLRELLLVEGVVTSFRLLALDVLSGLDSDHSLSISELGILLQEVAALAVQLNLAVLLFDFSGQTYLPIRPPTFLVERMSDELFDDLANQLVRRLLVPAGAAELLDEDGPVRIFPYRCMVDTPRWVDKQARTETLATMLELSADELSARPTRSTMRLRAVKMAQPETDRRFWLGRPFSDLRSAVAGRRLKRLIDGYVEVQ